MRKSVTVLVAILMILALGTSVYAATPRGLPHRYAPKSLDGRLTQVTRVEDGSILAAWAYRNGPEYDIAISRADENGRWSEPVFIGVDDGRDQVQPVLTLDADGNAYLAFADRAAGRILLSKLRADGNGWTLPMVLTAPGTGAESPSLLVAGDKIIVAYRIGDEVKMIALPLTVMDGIVSLDTIVDHPDPVEYVSPPGDAPPIDGWKDGKWIIGDTEHSVEVMIQRRGPSSDNSGTTR